MLGATAGHTIREAVDASGEPPIPQLADLYDSNADPAPTSEFWKLSQLRENFRTEYHEYWKSTRRLTACKRAVDGVILPIAAHAAAPEGSFKYYGLPIFLSVTNELCLTKPIQHTPQFQVFWTLRRVLSLLPLRIALWTMNSQATVR